jgi:hypothetical protein
MGPGCAISSYSDENAIKYLKTHINWNLSCCEYFFNRGWVKIRFGDVDKTKRLR